MPLRDLSHSRVCSCGEHDACVSSGWCAARIIIIIIIQGWSADGGGVANKGILKKVNLRQLHLDTLLSFPKAISRRTKLGTAAAWSGAIHRCLQGERESHNPCSVYDVCVLYMQLRVRCNGGGGIRRLVTHGFVIISKDHCCVSSAQTLRAVCECVCACVRRKGNTPLHGTR